VRRFTHRTIPIRIPYRIVILTLILAVGLISAFAAAALQSGPQKDLTADQWQADLDFLAAELPKSHKDLFFKLPRERFLEMVKNLRNRIPNLQRSEIVAGLMKILAAVGDAHTDTYIRPAEALPLMLYWFDDGIFILNTTAPYREALHGRITAMGGHPITEVIEALSTLIPHENQAQVKNKLPSLLTRTDLLFGLGLIPGTAETTLSFLNKDAEEKTITISPVSMSRRPQWLSGNEPEERLPLYRRKAKEDYWFEFIEGSGTLYVKYNSCRNIPGRPFPRFTEEVFAFADSHDVGRLVIDLRHNGGGNSGIFAPFLAAIKERESLNSEGRLFVLIGRRTFSSAVLNALELQNQTAALFAGEPTGGKPNHFGEIKYFRLPNSGIPIQYSTKYFSYAGEDSPSLMPDIPVKLNFADYKANTDPVLREVMQK
jgi:hypothetical protein